MKSIGETGNGGRAFEGNWYTDFAGDGGESFATFSRSTLVIYPDLYGFRSSYGMDLINFTASFTFST